MSSECLHSYCHEIVRGKILSLSILYFYLRHFLWCAQVFLCDEHSSLHELRIRMITGLGARAYWGQALHPCSVHLDHRRTVCFASRCQLSGTGSPNHPLLGVPHLPPLIPNLVLVVEVCRRSVLLSKANFWNQEAGFLWRKSTFLTHTVAEKKKDECTLKVQKLESKSMYFFLIKITIKPPKMIFKNFWDDCLCWDFAFPFVISVCALSFHPSATGRGVRVDPVCTGPAGTC